MAFNNVKGEVVGFNSSLSTSEAKGSAKKGTVFFTTDGKIVLCGNEYGGLNAEEVESLATDLLEQYDEVWSAALNDLHNTITDDMPEIINLASFTTSGQELPDNSIYYYNDLPVEDVRYRAVINKSNKTITYYVIFKCFDSASRKRKYYFFHRSSTSSSYKYTFSKVCFEEDLSEPERYAFVGDAASKYNVDSRSVGYELPTHTFIPFIGSWPCDVASIDPNLWFYHKDDPWLYKYSYNGEDEVLELAEAVFITDIPDAVSKAFGLDVHDRLDALETDNTSSKGRLSTLESDNTTSKSKIQALENIGIGGRLETLEGASGKTANLLKFGTKSFDGSSEQTITASDLGIDNPWHVEGSVDGEYGSYSVEGSHIIHKTNGTTHDFIKVSFDDFGAGPVEAIDPTWGTGDGSATLPNNNPPKGSIVLYNNKEFWWNGSVWSELGDEGSFALKSNTYTKSETYSKSEVDSKVSSSETSAGNYTDTAINDIDLASESVDGTKVSVKISRGGTQIDSTDLPVATSEKAGVISAADRAQIYANKSNIENVYTKNDVYTKSETYSKSEVYTKSDVYTKDEVDTELNKLVKDIDIDQNVDNVEITLRDRNDGEVTAEQIPSATQQKAGVMSAEDKTQLDSNTSAITSINTTLASKANTSDLDDYLDIDTYNSDKANLVDGVNISTSESDVEVGLVAGGNVADSETIPSATKQKAGVMSAADKKQLDDNTAALRTCSDVIGSITNQLIWE